MKRDFTFSNTDCSFSYQISDFDKITTKDFFEAIDLTSTEIYDEMKQKNISSVALLLSGIDSEMIANSLYNLKIPTEHYFFHITGVNDHLKELVESISKKYDTKLNIFESTLDEVLNYTLNNFHKNYIAYPLYSAIPFFMDRIPNNQYIIIGEGDLEKRDLVKYFKIYEKKANTDDQTFYIPMHLCEITYRMALDNANKIGESNFYSRNFNLWYHILKDNRLITNEKYYYDPKTVLINEIKAEKQLLSPIKTINFSTTKTNNDNLVKYNSIMEQLKEIGHQNTNWNHYIGDLVSVPKDLVFSN
jgi:hypothetical protein